MTPNTPAGELKPDEVEVLMWPEKRGGMKVGMETGVIVHHRESGLAVGCRSERSQHKNREIALARLNATLGHPPATVPLDAVLALVAKWRKDADFYRMPDLRHCADELEALTRGEK